MWNFEGLFDKSVVFTQKGLDKPNHEDPDVPLNLICALELLARSVLSKVNPALLADPQDGNNILFACGFPSTKSPKSIPTKTVFHRCTVICPLFTEKEYELCMIWANYRNEELHTGSNPFLQLKPSKWMPDYFRISKILLDNVEKNILDFVGSEHKELAEKMILAADISIRKSVSDEIRIKKEEFSNKSVKERLKSIEDSEKSWKTDWRLRVSGKKTTCPSCEGVAVIRSELVRSSPPRDNDGILVQDDLKIPVALKCLSCGLEIIGHHKMHSLGLGDQYTEQDELDPKEFYNIKFDPSDYYEEYGEEYGND